MSKVSKGSEELSLQAGLQQSWSEIAKQANAAILYAPAHQLITVLINAGTAGRAPRYQTLQPAAEQRGGAEDQRLWRVWAAYQLRIELLELGWDR